MDEQLARIEAKLRLKHLVLNPVAAESQVRAFEEQHQIELPIDYRFFLTRLGNGGPGPPHYGLEPLGTVPSDLSPQERVTWSKLPFVRHSFPFT